MKFHKICRENSSFIKIWQEYQVHYTKTDICAFILISRWVLLKVRKISDKICRENQNTVLRAMDFFHPKIVPFARQRGKTYEEPECALHARYLRLQTHTRNKHYLLIFHCDNVYTNAPQCYVIRTLFFLCGSQNKQRLFPYTALTDWFV